jgi:hypothetical protein
MGFGWSFRDNDWNRLRQIIQKIGSIDLGPQSTPTFAGMTITGDATFESSVTIGGTLDITGAVTIGGNLNMQCNEIQNFLVHNVADISTREALTCGASQMAFQVDDERFWGHKRIATGGILESFEGDFDGGTLMFNSGEYRGGMSFTSAGGFTMTYVTVPLWRTGTPGTATMEIYIADGGGLPTGAVLATATKDVDSIPEANPGEWVQFILDSSVVLAAGQQYVMTMYTSTAGTLNWAYDNGGVYAGGTRLTSSDYGVTWSNDFTRKNQFRAYGGTPSLWRPFAYENDDVSFTSVTTDYMDLTLEPSPAVTNQEGRIYWNSNDGTMNIGLAGD